MGKSLIIVESPAKTKTLRNFLGDGYDVQASMGHVRDLPEKDLGVSVEDGFRPKYVSIASKRLTLKKLAEAAKSADRVFLASDPDREGEAIAWHLAQALKLDDAQRLEFHELTRSGVQAAIKSPRPINGPLVEAQEARRIVDRLVGYRLSPLLWRKIRKGLSAGRVQSVAVRIICDREREILAFVPEEYWTITATVTPQAPEAEFPFDSKLWSFQSEKLVPHSEAEAQAVLDGLQGATYTVQALRKREQRRNPAAPFITSTLQQEASRKLSFSNKLTMSVAQDLYEGIELGSEGAVGLITYMRTDSVRIAQEAIDDVRGFIGEYYGPQYLPAEPRRYQTRESAQDAHEAIRPTYPHRTPDSLAGFLNSAQLRLYRLIWNRFVACQMPPAVFDVTSVDIEANGYVFRATGSVMRFDGFTKVYTEGKDTEEKSDEEKDPLPALVEGQVLDLVKLDPKQKFTEPPPRFTEATLVKALEERKIGRPSTYASIVSTIQDREYVVLAEKKFRPTDLGFVVNDKLVLHFPDIMDIDFTAKLEEDLDQIAGGGVDRLELLTRFYGPFNAAIEKANDEMERVKPEQVETDHVCPNCGKKMMLRQSDRGPFLGCSGYPRCKTILNVDENGNPGEAPPKAETSDTPCPNCGKAMVVRQSRRGPFLGCTGYPKCRGTLPLPGAEGEAPAEGEGAAAPAAAKPEPVVSDQVCPKCGKPLLERTGRFGKFLGCSGYPACKTIVKVAGDTGPARTPAAAVPTGIACPVDGGDIVEKQSRRGATFYGCANYPNCKFATFHKPLERKCEVCGYPMGEKSYRGKTTGEVVCTNEECGHKAE